MACSHSYGILAVRIDPKHQHDVLLIQRKNSVGYIEFIKSKKEHNFKTLQRLFDEMTTSEKKMIETQPFEMNWQHIWHTSVHEPLQIPFQSRE